MRRYYNRGEIESARNIIALDLDGTIGSDLRTSALFSYLGKKDIGFGRTGYKLHDTIFYEYENVSGLDIDYIILSESMRNIVYSISFETIPVDDKFFEYYKDNLGEIYNDGLMYIYGIKK